LRREEVAQLAGMGTTWYTWLEQGRDVRASLSVLESLAQTLDLNDAERAHLILLGRGEPVPETTAPEDVDPTVRAIIEDGLGDRPACLLGRRWDFLAWNTAFSAAFGDPGRWPLPQRNMVWVTFADPQWRKQVVDWEQGARSCLARFRADSARYVGDPSFAQLIETVSAASPEFRAWWPRHEVMRTASGTKALRHPSAGKMFFQHASFRVEDNRDQRISLFTPLAEADTPAKLAQLLAAR
jgi:transcriptional regulator with XRE-family HTH domain